MNLRTTKVVLLNGPPNSGKDAGAEYLCQRYSAFTHKEFKQKLFELVWLIYDIPEHHWWSIYTRDLKDQPQEILSGLSPREALIKVSEEVIKPKYGKDYFGQSAVRNLEPGCTNVFSDSGFVEEAQPLIDSVGQENILLIKLVGRGTFEGDNLKYFDIKI